MLRHRAVADERRAEISGHFHPKVTIRHRHRIMRRRCFAVGASRLILPAYGSLAGGLDVEDKAFAGLFTHGLEAVVCEGGRMLRFVVRPFTNLQTSLKGSGG